MNTYEKETEIILRKLGVNGSYLGFKFVIYGVEKLHNNPMLITSICKGLYTEIAIHFNTSVYCAERNIRTIKEIIWRKADRKLLEEMFGNDVTIYPNNAEFMDYLAVHIERIVNTRSE